MRTFVLLLLLAMLPLTAAAAEPCSVHATITGSEDVFPISFWCGPPRDFVSVERYQHGLVRLAPVFAPSHTAAEQAVQETWLDVLQGALRFDGRASLKLWIFRLLVERLAARGEYVPFALEADAASSAACDYRA